MLDSPNLLYLCFSGTRYRICLGKADSLRWIWNALSPLSQVSRENQPDQHWTTFMDARKQIKCEGCAGIAQYMWKTGHMKELIMLIPFWRGNWRQSNVKRCDRTTSMPIRLVTSTYTSMNMPTSYHGGIIFHWWHCLLLVSICFLLVFHLLWSFTPNFDRHRKQPLAHMNRKEMFFTLIYS